MSAAQSELSRLPRNHEARLLPSLFPASVSQSCAKWLSGTRCTGTLRDGVFVVSVVMSAGVPE